MTESYVEQASEEHQSKTEGVMSISDFLSHAKENPVAVADAVNYLLEAIEHFGTRTVFEDGEERERFCFFDDPYGNGEHAILGNTETLNEFVDELRRRASEEGDNNKIIWFLGPTATGKSELKRCLINGLRGFAETEHGARWTLEWTLDDASHEVRMSYGNAESVSKEWYKSPINVNPLAILPEQTRQDFLNDIDKPYDIDTDLDPFSRESLERLQEKYDTFEEIVESDSVRVTRIQPEVGDGVGVLHSEDDGNPKAKLVGSWMNGAMEKFAKRGSRNPQAFSYEGVLAQGNGSISIVEDAGHHSDVLDKMLNVCEEEMVKLDNKIAMDLDTLIFAFSNPDLEGQLEEYAEAGHADPLRALRRRLDKYDFGYLTTVSTEGMLIKRLLQDDDFLWEDQDSMLDKVSESMELYGSHISPRAIEAASMFEVATRLEPDTVDAVENALLLEHGEVENEIGNIINIDEVEEGQDYYVEGDEGIPVTFTVDVLVELAQEQDTVLPSDVLEEMNEQLDEEPLFHHEEVSSFKKATFDVNEYILDRQENDVLEAMVGDVEVTEEDVQEYVDSLLAWQDGEEENYDSYELKEFETRYLGQEESDYGSSAVANTGVVDFRKKIILPINRYMWEERDEDFTAGGVPVSESPSLEPLLEENDWEMVARMFPDADPSQWENPPERTETEKLKEKTVKRMKELHGYSEESAEAVSKRVIETQQSVSEVFE